MQVSGIDGSTRVCAVFGDPVDHSLSPRMQNAAFESARLNVVYVPFRVSRRQLSHAMAGLRSLHFIGANITNPNKELAISMVDRLNSEAQKIGAVNTIVNNGGLIGYNTDGEGAIRALKEAHIDLDGAIFTILGAGGAAKAISHSLAKHADQIRIFNRTPEKAAELARQIRKNGARATGAALSRHQLLQRSIAESDVLINATSVGMKANPRRTLVDSRWLHDGLSVFDVIYRPNRTKLLKMAEARGLRAVNGLGMLLHQGALGFELWTGKRAPISAMRAALVRGIREGAN